jgi:hypothetical protein
MDRARSSVARDCDARHLRTALIAVLGGMLVKVQGCVSCRSHPVLREAEWADSIDRPLPGWSRKTHSLGRSADAPSTCRYGWFLANA